MSKKAPDWIVWNKESKNVVYVGPEEQAKHRADILNESHQTDAFSARTFEDN